MIISDLVTTKEVHGESINAEDYWCSCLDGALTKENYINCIKEVGFQNVRVLNEKPYMEPDNKSDRKITSVIIGAVTGK
jgi:arsenite methyltransferase